MGAGNDTVTSAGLVGTGGSVAAGDGTGDKIIMASAEAAVADNDSTFNTKFTGFEVLQLSNELAAGTTLDLDGINAVSKVILTTGGNTMASSIISNLASGGTVETLTAGSAGFTVNVKSALVGAADVLNLSLKSATALGNQTVTAANVETVNVAIADATTAGGNAVIHALTLAATSATSVVVTGNNGLTLTNTGNTAITNFDASGIVANDTAATTSVVATTDSAANLAVTFASANVTATANVTIKGGAGNDTLTGSIAKDTISGNAGADRIYSDNAGAKQVQEITITDVALEVADTITIAGISTSFTGSTTAELTTAAIVAAVNANTSLAGIATASDSTGGVMKVTFLVDGVQTAATFGGTAATGAVVLDGTGTSTAGTAGTTAIDVIDGGAGNDVLVGGGGADTITTGAGADTVFMLKAHSTLATMATITDFTFATGGTSNDKIILGDVVAAIGTVVTVQDLSASATLAAAADAAALANTGVANGLSVFIWGGNEYVYVETTAANTGYTAGDFMVKLTGLPLAAGATIAGSGFDAV